MWLGRRQLLASLAAQLAACSAPPAPVRPAPARPSPPDAHLVAIDVVTRVNPAVGARAWALFHVAAAHGTRVAQASRVVFGVGYLLDAMELEVADDVARVFTVSTGMTDYYHSCEAVHVFEHRLGEERVTQAFEAAVKNRRAERWVTPQGHRCARLRLGNVWRLLATPTPSLIVTLPEWASLEVASFAASSGLPPARAGEAVELACVRPEASIVGVEVPASLLDANVTVWLSSTGARLAFAALSADEASAAADAAWMTHAIDDALTLDLAIAELKVLGPYDFHADGRTVRSLVHFTPDETEWIVAMARKAQPGG